MAKGTRICKVCGKEYEYCHTERRVPGVFRWQEVACCVEHGSAYLAQVLASRQKDDSADGTAVETASVSGNETVENAAVAAKVSKKRSRKRSTQSATNGDAPETE